MHLFRESAQPRAFEATGTSHIAHQSHIALRRGQMASHLELDTHHRLQQIIIYVICHDESIHLLHATEPITICWWTKNISYPFELPFAILYMSLLELPPPCYKHPYQPGSNPLSRTALMPQHKAENLFLTTQNYSDHALLFKLPLAQRGHEPYRDSIRTRIIKQEIIRAVAPGVIAKPFVKTIVGKCSKRLLSCADSLSKMVKSNLSVPTSPALGVIVDNFCEDLYFTEIFNNSGGSLDQLQSAVEVEDLHATNRIGKDDLRGQATIVIRTVLDKTKVATYLLGASATTLAVGLVLGILFPNTDLGSTISTATIALACLLRACVAWCHN